MKTLAGKYTVQPLWRETIQLSTDLINQLEKCKDVQFVRRTKKLVGKLTKTMLTAMQSPPGTGLFDAMANFHSHSTELSLMLIRAEGLQYTDRNASARLMKRMYHIRQTISRVE